MQKNLIGVLNSKQAKELYSLAKKLNFAIPAVNVVNSESINAVLESASKARSPVILQFSHGGAKHFIGKGCPAIDSDVAGAVAGAKYIHNVAKYYQVPVVLHTDHANKKLLPWIDGLLKEGERYFKHTGKPLFTSHMLDLSVQPLEENVAICVDYLERFKKIDLSIEIELGITGGEEDGVDNTHIDNSLLYTQPSDVQYAYEKLSQTDGNFTIAASFGNVHGVYKPGNVKLTPKILKNSQEFIKNNLKLEDDKPVDFVFHGGSGSELEKIEEAISYGVIKMNIDTDTQWAFWSGVKEFEKNNKEFLQSQIGNPLGENKPNKAYYDPRVWLRDAQVSMANRVTKAFKELNCVGVLDKI
ncbi:MAG: class II fructose-bisphosphate aldolase [Campylobacteraceae bacterium 4484_166]|nr:MAG: class II fructose-bisphosphate aldolase [Campylobacteraceae bacterium 4484_166]